MTKRIEEMTRDEFKSHVTMRAHKIMMEANQCDTDAAHWNHEHPDEEPLPTDATAQAHEMLQKTFGPKETT